MASNEGLGYLRRNKRWEQEPFEPGHEPGVDDSAEERFLHNEMKASITAAINELPPKCRVVFQLSRYEELTYKEIAEQMDISVKTVENQMGKALRVLRVKLQQYLHVLLLFGLFWMTACQPARAVPASATQRQTQEHTALAKSVQEWAESKSGGAAAFLNGGCSQVDYANPPLAGADSNQSEIKSSKGTPSKRGVANSLLFPF
jgi:DNA-binding CsgD family transcriptional regulator